MPLGGARCGMAAGARRTLVLGPTRHHASARRDGASARRHRLGTAAARHQRAHGTAAHAAAHGTARHQRARGTAAHTAARLRCTYKRKASAARRPALGTASTNGGAATASEFTQAGKADAEEGKGGNSRRGFAHRRV
ncbi:unnamed protein product [Urochloa humidicola]